MQLLVLPDQLAALSIGITSPRIDLSLLRQQQIVIPTSCDLADLQAHLLDAVHQQRCRCKIELSVIEAELSLLV